MEDQNFLWWRHTTVCEHENEEVAFKVVIYNVALDTLIQSRFETTTKIDNMFSFVWNSRVDSKSSRTIHVLDKRLESWAICWRDASLEQHTWNLFPLTCVTLRIFISIPVSVSQGKCSFSKLLKIFYDLLWVKTTYRTCNALTGVWSGKRTQLLQYYRFVCFMNSEKVKTIGTCVKHNLMQSCLYILFLFLFLLLINCMRAQELKQTHAQKKAAESSRTHLRAPI